MPRLFYALWPDTSTRARLDAAAQYIDVAGGRRVAAEKLHITLIFLGEVGAAAVPAVMALGEDIAHTPFALELTEAGWWRQSRVAWLAAREVPAGLLNLATVLRERAVAAGLRVDKRPFHAHLTVARDVRRKPRIAAVPAVSWRVTGFALVGSVTTAAGARYEVLRSWPLEPRAAQDGGEICRPTVQ